MIERNDTGAPAVGKTASLVSGGSIRARIGLGFWLLWVSATFVGIAVGMGILIAGVGEALDSVPAAAFGVAIGGIFGTTLGAAQWLVLRRHVGGLSAWVPLTIAGWVVFWSLNFGGAFGQGEGVVGKILEGFAHGLILGVLVGAAQWTALRKRVNGARRWIVVSGLCWSLSAAVADGSRVLLGVPGPFDLLIAFALAGGLSGLGMAWLLRRPLRES